jgi:hypothetical protein
MRDAISVSEHMRKLPAAVRPIVQSARRTVKAVAPRAKELAYQTKPPRSSRSMWKIIRFTLDGEYTAAIGTFPTYATLFFPRGRELDDENGLLEGSGKTFRFIRLRTPADATRPAVKRLIREAVTLSRTGGANAEAH